MLWMILHLQASAIYTFNMADYSNIQTYGQTPKYITRQSEDDQLAIMFCDIRVWTADGTNWFEQKNYIRLTEVESIDIEKSYKKIIQKATVKFPRGTVVGHRISKEDSEIISGNQTKAKEETSLNLATGGGDTLVPGSGVDKNGNAIMVMDAFRKEDGTIIVSKNDDKELVPIMMRAGDRIEIRLAYAYSEEEYEMYKEGNLQAKLEFSGFISKCSVTTPITLQCEDMMSILKTVSCPKNVAKRNYTANDYLKDDGTFHLLKGTGLKLDDYTSSSKIQVGKVDMTNDLVVADVIDEWSKCGLYAFMNEEEDFKTIRIGRVYTSGFTYGKNGNIVKANGGVNIIQFDWDVANDGLDVVDRDKRYLAIECSGMKQDGHFIKLTLRKDRDDNWDVINERDSISRKTGRVKSDRTASTQGVPLKHPPKIDLENYNKVSYISPTNPITKETLIEEGKAYYTKFNPNGVSGKLTIFGDRYIKPTDTVGLLDTRHPERNGFYFVSEVNTKFSVSGGFRRELTLPYRLAKFPTSNDK